MAALPPIVELRQGDPKLGRPAERVDARRDFPDGIPGEILVPIIVDLRIELHARRVDSEFEARAAVVIGVEKQPDHVGGSEVIAAGEHGDDAVRMRIEGADKDVQVRRVVRDLRLGRQLRWPPFARPPFLEVADACGVMPDLVVVSAVDDWLSAGVHGGNSFRRRRCVPAAVWGLGIGRLSDERDGSEQRQSDQHDRPGGGY